MSERGRTTDASPSSGALLATELALLALAVLTALGFARVFLGWDWLAPLVLAAAGSWLVAVVSRRLGLGMLLSAAVSLLGLALLVTLTFYRDTAWLGGLPSWATRDALRLDLEAVWSQFSEVKALVPGDVGWLVPAMVALWLAVYLADGFAFRAQVALETLLPLGLVFVFSSAVGADRHRIVLMALWLVTALVVVALQRTTRDEDTGWLTGNRRGVAGSAARAGVALAGVAVVGGLVLAPMLPGNGAEALVDPTPGQGGGGTRTTLSPLVDIRGRLSNTSDVEAFRVQAERAAYWRLTSLDTFDGQVWEANGSYRDNDGDLSTSFDEGLTQPLRQVVTIDGLDSDWVPAAYTPVQVNGNRGVRYDRDSGSLLASGGDTRRGDTFEVVSAVPDLTPDTLRAVAASQAPGGGRYLQLPGGWNPSYTELSRRITDGTTSVYDQALALQTWFRTEFTYELRVPRGGDDPIADFLERRTGYCEQFAGTFAAFARSLGIPARVAVGFTPGERQPDGTFVVLGKHAHAWPEVWFQGVGWVPFEPTPSRGAPGAEGYTNVPAQQEGEPPAPAADPTATTAAATPNTSVGEVPDFGDDLLAGLPGLDLGASQGAAADPGLPGWVKPLLVLLAAAAVAVAWVLTVPRLVRRRWSRARLAATPAEEVLLAWHEAGEALEPHRLDPHPHETPTEHAQRVSHEARVAGAALTRLAEAATVAAFAPGEVDPAEASRAVRWRGEVIHEAHQGETRWQRLRREADPRPLFRPLPAVRAARAVDEDREPTPV